MGLCFLFFKLNDVYWFPFTYEISLLFQVLLLLLLLSRFSRVRLCVTPETAAHQAPQPTRLPVPGILQARTLEWGAFFSSAEGRKSFKIQLVCKNLEGERK